MSGTASVPTQFQAAVTATGLQLDNNFNTIVGYLNDPTNRMNYAADGGTTNTLVINPTPAVVGGYSAGLTITFRAAFTNNGAVVANVSGLGNSSVLDQQQRQLTVSALISGSVYQMAYNGTSAFNLLSPNNISALTQPALTTITSGAGTYTVSATAPRIVVKMVGGGGGGGGESGNGGTGGESRFGVLSSGGGLGGVGGGLAVGGVGGTATGATIMINGGYGGGGVTGAATLICGGMGASGPWGGAGRNGVPSANAQAGRTNSGSGGGGSQSTGTGVGGGGGAGAYCEHWFITPAASYTYSVGTAGVAGTGGAGGAAGGSGYIIIETYFA